MNKTHKELIANIKPEHDWDAGDTNPDTRCNKCSIKKGYYYDGIDTLKSWSDEEIDNEPVEVWKRKFEFFSRCPNS